MEENKKCVICYENIIEKKNYLKYVFVQILYVVKNVMNY